jgi:hypothetical protein
MVGSSGRTIGGGAMNDNFPQYRAARAVITGRASLTLAETSELRRLYDQVADTCDVAAHALGSDEDLVPTISELERVKGLNERVGAMLDRIRTILG